MTDPQPRVYLLDVEGTVAPISLVSEQLFPYARAHFESFFKEKIAALDPSPANLENEIAEGGFLWDMMQLKLENEAEQDLSAPRLLPPGLTEPPTVSMSPAVLIPRALEYVNWLMDRDRKSTALKSMQGKIWKTGFESGALKGTLFADVPDAFVRWSRASRVAIYSSGSVDAQRLLFRYSIFGDLTQLISGYFDTRTGSKGSSASYAAIASEMQLAPADILFFSDVVRELDAARVAGCATRLVVREGNAPVADANGHIIVESFSSV